MYSPGGYTKLFTSFKSMLPATKCLIVPAFERNELYIDSHFHSSLESGCFLLNHLLKSREHTRDVS